MEKKSMIKQEYYIETKGEKRKIILEEAQKENPEDVENQLRLELWNLRYLDQAKKPGKVLVDNFLGAWMDMLYLSNHNTGILGIKPLVRDLKKDQKKLGFPEAEKLGELGMQVLQEEITHLCRFYYNLCKTDRSYGTKLLGMISLKEEDITLKLAAEIEKVAYHLPRMAGMQEEMKTFTNAATDAFYQSFPDEKEKLEQLLEEYEVKE